MSEGFFRYADNSLIDKRQPEKTMTDPKVPKKSPLKYIFFSLIPLFLLVLVLELVLLAAGFQYSDTPLAMMSLKDSPTGVVEGVMRWDNRDGVIRMVKDPKQLWVPADSFEKKYSKKKSAGVTRIAALGDSCTAGCTDGSNYPALMEASLNGGGGPPVQVINAGVGSHSSYQGLQRLKYSVLPYRPDIITVFYGWNDHWITSVHDKDVKLKSGWQVSLINFLERFRTYQAYHYLISKMMGKEKIGAGTPAGGGKPDDASWIKFRVTTEDYFKNLESMVSLARDNGSKILLVTAPYDAKAFKPFANFPGPPEALVQVHETYINVVRAVAQKNNVPLLDLAAIITPEKTAEVFSNDGVHYHAQGCRIIAGLFAEKIKSLGWIE